MNNVLTDIIPAKYRRYVYAALTVAVFVYGVWQASDGDWRTFVGSLVTSLIAGTAASNIHETE